MITFADIEAWIFPVSVLLLMAVEITLIITIVQLKREIKKLNGNMNEYFGKILERIKGMVELFLNHKLSEVGLTGGKMQLEGNKFTAGVTIEKKP